MKLSLLKFVRTLDGEFFVKQIDSISFDLLFKDNSFVTVYTNETGEFDAAFFYKDVENFIYHRRDGPAVITFRAQEFYINGVQVSSL